MLGYLTRKKAKELGYKHGGRYYGIPVYFTEINEEEDGPITQIAASWAPLDFLMLLVVEIEQTVLNTLWPHEEHSFHFIITEDL